MQRREQYHTLVARSAASPLNLQDFSVNADIPLRQLGATSRQQCSKQPLFDHLVGKGKQRRRKREVERFRRLEIEHQLEFGRLLNRQIAGFCALEDLIDE